MRRPDLYQSSPGEGDRARAHLDELAKIVGSEDWTAVVTYVAELVRDRDRLAARLRVLEEDRAAIRSIVEGRRT